MNLRFMATLMMLSLVIVAGLSGCGGDPAGANDPTADKTTQPKELTAAEIAVVAPQRLERVLAISGSLAPLNATMIRAKVPGEILEVMHREGESVQKGDVLVRLDTRTLSAQLKSSEAALDKARADLEIARLNFENSKRLFDRGVLPKTDYDTRRSQLDAALATVKLSEAQLAMARIALYDAVVRAPFDGIVARRLIDVGGKASQDTPLLELVDLKHMEFQASAPAIEMNDVKVGQHARVRVDGYADEQFDAQLERISPVAEQGSRLVLLYLSMDNADARLRGGMFAQGELVLQTTEPVLAVPDAAVRDDNGQAYVLVIDDGKLERRDIEPGLESAHQRLIEVRSGLRAGEQVIALRFSSLEAGTAVLVVDGN